MRKLQYGSAVPAREARRPGSSEMLVGRNGEINGSSKQDLMKSLISLAGMVQAGEVLPQHKSDRVEATAADMTEAREQLVAAFNSDDRRPWKEIGAAIGSDVGTIADREGFMRRLVYKSNLEQGQVARIRVRIKNTRAFAAASPTQLQPITVRNKYIYPPEFYLRGSIVIDRLELAQGSPDLMEEKFFELQEQTMREEDAILRKLMLASAAQSNDLLYISGSLTPTGLGTLKKSIESWQLPSRTLLMASDLMNDITTSTGFSQWLDPVSQLEVVMSGRLGTVLGLEILTDAYRAPELKVLNAGELFVMTTPEYFATYTDRGPLETAEIDRAVIDGTPSRGWTFIEMLSMTLHNSRGVARGIRQ